MYFRQCGEEYKLEIIVDKDGVASCKLQHNENIKKKRKKKKQKKNLLVGCSAISLLTLIYCSYYGSGISCKKNTSSTLLHVSLNSKFLNSAD